MGEPGAHEDFVTHGVVSTAALSKHGMMEYIGFVSIMLSRGKDLVPAGFVGQVSIVTWRWCDDEYKQYFDHGVISGSVRCRRDEYIVVVSTVRICENCYYCRYDSCAPVIEEYGIA